MAFLGLLPIHKELDGPCEVLGNGRGSQDSPCASSHCIIGLKFNRYISSARGYCDARNDAARRCAESVRFIHGMPGLIAEANVIKKDQHDMGNAIGGLYGLWPTELRLVGARIDNARKRLLGLR